MTLYQRNVARMYAIPLLSAAGVFCTTVVSAVGQALGVLGAGLTQAYLHAPTPTALPPSASGGV
jgi:hypothetical protein